MAEFSCPRPPLIDKDFSAVLTVIARQTAVAGPGEGNRQQDDNQKTAQGVFALNQKIRHSSPALAEQSAGARQACFGARDIGEGVPLPLVLFGQKFAFLRQMARLNSATTIFFLRKHDPTLILNTAQRRKPFRGRKTRCK